MLMRLPGTATTKTKDRRSDDQKHVRPMTHISFTMCAWFHDVALWWLRHLLYACYAITTSFCCSLFTLLIALQYCQKMEKGQTAKMKLVQTYTRTAIVPVRPAVAWVRKRTEYLQVFSHSFLVTLLFLLPAHIYTTIDCCFLVTSWT